MDVKKDVVEPIATGIAVLALVAVLQWILDAVGFAPFASIAVHVSVQGVIGLTASLWVVGKLVNKIPSFVENLLKNIFIS